MFSWFCRTISSSSSNSNSNKHNSKIEQDEEFYGVTLKLIEFITSLNLDTFKNFSIPEEEDGGIQTTFSGVRVDLSEWQQKHATIILSKVKVLLILLLFKESASALTTKLKIGFGSLQIMSRTCILMHGVLALHPSGYFPDGNDKELSHLRYMLCPRHMKERQFWRIYFSLVKSYVTEYELQAIRHDKLSEMATEKEKALVTNGIELEMTEAKQSSSSAPP